VGSAPDFDASERWEVGRGNGASLYVAGAPKKRVKVADFGLGGSAPGGSAAAHDRALVAAQAPRMYLALLDMISGMRGDGSIVELDGSPYKGHGPGCGCGVCDGLLALALAEGGGRCIVCGCTDDDACADGCVWVDGAHLLCSGHPEDVLKKAERFLAKGGR
jgi:hypothetical protein